MAEVGLWIPRLRRLSKIYQPRNRRSCLGELVQIDGSAHAWFEARAPACTVLVYVDDATSRLLYLHFTYSESTFSYFEATRAYLKQCGKPLVFYSDKATVFRCNQKNAAGGDGYTQFGRVLFPDEVRQGAQQGEQDPHLARRPDLFLYNHWTHEHQVTIPS
jgi:hypothetical protein